MEDRAVTPSLALGLIKKHLQPLIPAEHQDILGNLKKASWDRLNWTRPSFVFRADEANGLLSQIDICIDCICKYTTYPPRGWLKFDKIENNIFLQICGFLKIDITKLSIWIGASLIFLVPVNTAGDSLFPVVQYVRYIPLVLNMFRLR
ncbi:MAG: hypothetical protein ABL933_17860 [Methyloglobulus sp.]